MSHLAHSVLISGPFEESYVLRQVRRLQRESQGVATLAFVFVTADWRPFVEELVDIVRVEGRVTTVVGCSCYGVIGRGEEKEHGSGCSIVLLQMPGVTARVHRISASDVEGIDHPHQWCEKLDVDRDEVEAWFVLANPGAFPVERWLQGWNGAYPGIPCIGGLASGGEQGEGVFLFWDGMVVEDGALLVDVQGRVVVDPIVSQGCRPIGKPYTITSANENIILTIGSKPAYEVLEEAFASLRLEEKERARGNLFVGLATSEYREDFGQGDFLIRNLIGGDPNLGALLVGAHPRVGQTIQFQLRDEHTADRDLRQACEEVRQRGCEPFAALLFCCAGRGYGLFGEEHHDALLFEQNFGPCPLAGFFASGEIGPVGRENFLHTYSAAFALLSSPI